MADPPVSLRIGMTVQDADGIMVELTKYINFGDPGRFPFRLSAAGITTESYPRIDSVVKGHWTFFWSDRSFGFETADDRVLAKLAS